MSLCYNSIGNKLWFVTVDLDEDLLFIPGEIQHTILDNEAGSAKESRWISKPLLVMPTKKYSITHDLHMSAMAAYMVG